MRLTETYDNLIEKLKTKEEYFDEKGDLLKSKVIYEAQNDSENILDILLSDEKLSNTYFKTVKDTKIFLKDKFINTINHKEFFPSSYTSYLNYIGLSDGTDFIKKSKNVVLNFPYKDCILEGGQSKEEQSLKEFFYNETLANDEVDRLLHPKVFTNIKKYTKDGEEENPTFKHTDNLLIKGNNLIALHSLVKRYYNSVKLVYIDPPYNPTSVANTFSYNNRFNHSSWLTFMKNRAEIAKKFLTDDGFYCVAIDHYELFYLGVMCDEVFGVDNRVGIISVETNPRGRRDSEFFATSNEYFIVYAKDITKAKINDLPLTDDEKKEYKFEDSISKYKLVPLKRTGSNSTPNERPNLFYTIYYNEETNEISIDKKDNFIEINPIGEDGVKRVWRWSKGKLINTLDDIEIKKSNSNYTVYVKDRIKYGRKPKTFWYSPKYDASSHGTILLKKMNLSGEFSYPKSIHLMKDIISVLTERDDVILDFHSGSGTTAHSVLELNKEEKSNRKFIAIEQMDYIKTVTKERILKYMSDNESLIYMELMTNNQSYIDTITESTTSSQLIEIKNELRNSNFIRYEVKDENLFDENNQFDTLSVDEQKEILIKILDKNHLYVNYSEMDDTQFEISDEVKKFNREFYEVK